MCHSLLEYKYRMSQAGDSVFLSTDGQCLQVFAEGLPRLLSFWSPCGRCSRVTILLWLRGVCLFKESSREQWLLLFPSTCPFVWRQGGRGCHFYKDMSLEGGMCHSSLFKKVLLVLDTKNSHVEQNQILKLILSYIVLGFERYPSILKRNDF